MYIIKASASRLNTFDTCIFKYFLTYEVLICKNCERVTCVSQLLERNIDLSNKICPFCGDNDLIKPEMRSNFAAQFGSCIHKVLELYAKDRKAGKVRDWQSDLVEVLSNGIHDTLAPDWNLAKEVDFVNIEPTCNSCEFNVNGHCQLTKDPLDRLRGCSLKIWQRACDMVSEAIARYDDKYANNLLGTEIEFNEEISEDIRINGYLDAVFEHDKHTLEVIDYKTGNWTHNYDELLDEIQPQLYSIACKRLFPSYSDVLLTFDYFTKQPVTVTYSQNDDNKTIRDIVHKFDVIKNQKRLIRISADPEYFKCKFLCDRELCDKVWSQLRKQDT